MNILMQARENLMETCGGDTVQVLKTKEYLQKLGIAVDLSLNMNPDLGKYDIVHLFNTTRIYETYYQFQHAKKQNKKVALSPIFWNMEELENHRDKEMNKGKPREILKQFERQIRHTIKPMLARRAFPKPANKTVFMQWQKDVLKGADILLPNAKAEAECIEKAFGIRNRTHIIPNGIEPDMADACNSRINDSAETVPRNAILCAARIDFRKNQVGLLKAFQEIKQQTGPLILAGNYEEDDSYYNKCKRLADSRVIFTGSLPQNQLPPLYVRAKVHVLASFYETPGLASLEAAVFGCNIVTTERGSTREYFKDLAFYCDPTDIASIKKAILEAYQQPQKSKLKEHILKHYTWEIAARETLKAYEMIL